MTRYKKKAGGGIQNRKAKGKQFSWGPEERESCNRHLTNGGRKTSTRKKDKRGETFSAFKMSRPVLNGTHCGKEKKPSRHGKGRN